jgi:hypothetical protein
MPILILAVLYFAAVFAAGFLLGPIRVFWLEPRLGETAAVLRETPFLLIAMVAAARWVPGRTGLRAGLGSLAGMGVVALALQQTADFTVGAGLRGISPDE